RRRHTRWPRDWSSDVCSSDLDTWSGVKQFGTPEREYPWRVALDSGCNVHVSGTTKGSLGGDTNAGDWDAFLASLNASGSLYQTRSEERRVGKECGERGAGRH